MSSIQDHGQQTSDIIKLSKTQMKKQIRRQKWLDSKGERRKLEREKRKNRRKILAKERGKTDDNNIVATICRGRPTLMANSRNKFRIVIDLDFEDYMTDSEIAKSVQQVGRIYAANRHSEHPCQLYISSLKGKICDKFGITNTGYQNWDINYSELDYIDLFKCDDQDNEMKKDHFVYLSGDADDTLPDVDSILKDESRIFVIGGLVDHNRHKNLCYKRAIERNIPTAKLPIKEHVTLCQRHILSTLTVFEIMLQVLGSHKQWPEALISSIPKRKIAQPSIETKFKDSAESEEAEKLDYDTKQAINCDENDS